jgi:hypothetical protein
MSSHERVYYPNIRMCGMWRDLFSLWENVCGVIPLSSASVSSGLEMPRSDMVAMAGGGGSERGRWDHFSSPLPAAPNRGRKKK